MYTTPSRLSSSSFVVVPSAEQSKALCTLLPVHPCMVVELYMAVLPTQQPQHCYAYTLADRLPHWTTKLYTSITCHSCCNTSTGWGGYSCWSGRDHWGGYLVRSCTKRIVCVYSLTWCHIHDDTSLCATAKHRYNAVLTWVLQLYFMLYAMHSVSHISYVAKVLISQFLSNLLQCCHDRPPISHCISSVVFTAQPSVEDFPTSLLTTVAVVSLYYANQALSHSKAAS